MKTLITLTVLSTGLVLGGCTAKKESGEGGDAAKAVESPATALADAGDLGNTTAINFNVTGMSCGNCAAAVVDAAKKVPGVVACEVNLDEGLATVNVSDENTEAAIVTAIEAAGFTAERAG